MSAFEITLLVASFLCSLVAGFLFAFAVVVMPGIAKLDDRGFIRAFQVIDGVIQRNQPLFMLVWLGSAIALIVATAMGMGQLDANGRIVLGVATGIYLLGVQLPTIIINVPLNNQLQTINVETADDTTLSIARAAFEMKWNRWNVIRTLLATATTILLLTLLAII